MVDASDKESRESGFECCWGWNSAHDCMKLHCTELFLVIIPAAYLKMSSVWLYISWSSRMYAPPPPAHKYVHTYKQAYRYYIHHIHYIHVDSAIKPQGPVVQS